MVPKISITNIIIFIAIYTIIAIIIDRYLLDKQNINISGPILSIRSNVGINFAERIASNERITYYWGQLGVVFMFVGAILGLFLVATTVRQMIISPANTVSQGPTDVLVIPGVNRFLPLSVTPEIIISLFIGLVVHEAGHAIMCRLSDIEIDSTGVILFSLIPIGAFVEPNEESQEEADEWPTIRMLSGGIMNNIFISTIALFIFFVITSQITVTSGVGVGTVYQNSPAADADIQKGDVIVDTQRLYSLQSDATNQTREAQKANKINVVLLDDKNTTMDLRPYIVSAPGSSLPVRRSIIGIDGDRVTSPEEVTKKLRTKSKFLDVELANGKSKTVPIGAYSTVKPSTSLKHINESKGFYIFSVNSVRMYNEKDLRTVLGNSSNNVSLSVYQNGETDMLTADSTSLSQSIDASDNISGIQTVQFGIQRYQSERYINLIKFSGNRPLQQVGILLFLPAIGTTGQFSYNFPGFSPFIQNFFEISGLSGSIEGLLFFTASVSFWTAWINLNVAIFNCIPTYLLDGGHMVDSLLEKTDISDEATRVISHILKSIVLVLILLMVFLPIIV